MERNGEKWREESKRSRGLIGKIKGIKQRSNFINFRVRVIIDNGNDILSFDDLLGQHYVDVLAGQLPISSAGCDNF